MQPQFLLEIAIVAARTERPQSLAIHSRSLVTRLLLVSSLIAQEHVHHGRDAIPLGLLGRQLPPAGGSDRVESLQERSLGGGDCREVRFP